MTAWSSLHTPLIKLSTCNTKWPLHSELQVHFSHDTPTLLFTSAVAQKRLGASQSCPKLFSTTRHNNCLVTCKTTIGSRFIFAPECQQISKQLTFGHIHYVETENKFPTWWVTGGRMFELISLVSERGCPDMTTSLPSNTFHGAANNNTGSSPRSRFLVLCIPGYIATIVLSYLAQPSDSLATSSLISWPLASNRDISLTHFTEFPIKKSDPRCCRCCMRMALDHLYIEHIWTQTCVCISRYTHTWMHMLT